MGALSSDFFTISTYVRYATIPSTLIIVILAFLQRRFRPNPCGYYHPAVVKPMRFLDGYKNRLSYAMCFGAITTILVSMFFKSIIKTSADNGQTRDISTSALFNCDNNPNVTSMCDHVWAQTLLLQAETLVVSLVCAPHFICISTSYRLFGALMGFAYSVYWIVFYLIGAVKTAKYSDKTIGTIMLVQDIPSLLCFFGLCIRSIFAVYKCYRHKNIRIEVVENLVEEHQVQHVVSLFQKPPESPPPPEGFLAKLKARLMPEIFPHFRLPTRIICIAFVQCITIYYLTMTLANILVSLRRALKAIFQMIGHNQTISDESEVIEILDGVHITSTAIGALMSVIYVALFILNYRINMINIYRGEKEKYLSEPSSASSLMAQSLRLPGYQIGYVIWGYFIVWLVLFLILGIISYGIFALHKFGMLRSVVLDILQTLSVPLITIAVFYLQVLVVALFLLQPKIKSEDSTRPLNVDNRRLYEVMAYILVFNNLVIGIASCLFRTLKSFVLGVIFLGRLDRCLLMRGFENLDPGYMAYVGTLLVDNAHNNPVMRTFCALLTQLTLGDRDRADFGITHLPDKNTGSNSRAVRRWHLAYTLMHNPDLLSRRKLALLLLKQDDDKNDSRLSSIELQPSKFSVRSHAYQDSLEPSEDDDSIQCLSKRQSSELPKMKTAGPSREVRGSRGYGSIQAASDVLYVRMEEELDDQNSTPGKQPLC